AAYFASHKEGYKHLHSNYIGNVLNEIAMDYGVSMHGSDKLKKALQWSERAIRLNHSPNIQYTYARLLYITGQKSDAIKVLKDTIKELQTKNKEEQVENYKKDLLKMKNET